ncbi:MAG: AMP-binding protein, partial [Cyanobacteria bacterium P01_A01_bin.17]
QWPALPTSRAARLLAILQQLEETQWWSAEQLLGHQFQQLQRLFAHACQTVPLYQQQAEQMGLSASQRLTPSRWRQLPILTREQLQTNSEQFLSQSIPQGHQVLDTVNTSGSTGRPVSVHTTGITQLFWQVFALREHQWHQRDLTKTLASIRLFPKGHPAFRAEHRIESWGTPANLLYQTGPTVMFDLQSDIEKQLTWLQRQNPEYLLTFPSNALALAQLCQERQVSLPKLREVRTVSEVVDQQVRQACRQVWNAVVTDVYSSQEVGYIALQCPQHEHYHIQAENIYVEILDQAGNPCSPGEIGRVVVTPLHNFAMPLLRYDIGDYAEVGAPCPCGRGLPVLNRILGRVRNMLVLPSGERRWPILGEQRYAQIAPAIRQHQMIQRDLEHIEMRFVVDQPLTAAEETELRKFILSSQLRHPFQLSFCYPDAIERSTSGKFEEFLCQVPDAARIA